MGSIGDSIMLSDKILRAALAGGFAAILAACSNDSTEDGASTKHDAQAACAHINALCTGIQGFQGRDCSRSNADYQKLSATEKAQADAIVPCVMNAKACEAALECVTPPSSASPNASPEKKTRSYDPEDACEHINDVCASEAGFKKQNCSNSNAAYEKLSASEKEIADEVGDCIMSSQGCTAAFQCLDFN